MDQIKQFQIARCERIERNSQDAALQGAARVFLKESLRTKYSYNFSWMGRPIIQYPQDIVALQEIIWCVKPDLIIETGIAHGGSLIFSASMLELIGGQGTVLGIDVDIRDHNRTEIENHPMFRRIKMIEGSSIDEQIIQEVEKIVNNHTTVMVFLDSNHTCDHVLEELRLYSPFVSKGSYIVVFDGIIEEVSEHVSEDRPWGPGNSPLTAIRHFLRSNTDFSVDEEVENKALITAAPSGYLKRIHQK